MRKLETSPKTKAPKERKRDADIQQVRARLTSMPLVIRQKVSTTQRKLAQEPFNVFHDVEQNKLSGGGNGGRGYQKGVIFDKTVFYLPNICPVKFTFA